MHAYILTREVQISTSRYVRTFQAAISEQEASVDRVYIDVYRESEAVVETIKGWKDAPDDVREVWRAYPETALVSWEHCPVRLGRVSTKVVEGAESTYHDEAMPLVGQLEVLKKTKNKNHYRIAVVNGFGGNLGDTLIGMTAFRPVAKVLGEILPSFSVDILLGPGNSMACDELLGNEPWVENIQYHGPTLKEFSRYDAYFDVTGLINLPKYYEQPAVDWYLWWFGMDPKGVDPSSKRNRINIPIEEWNSVSCALRGVSGKRIYFNPRASVPLRSIPEKEIKRLILGMLDNCSEISIITDVECDVSHKRLTKLVKEIDNPLKFMALIAQCDGVVTVDSFAPQVADACAAPTVHINASLPSAYYPYYPHSAVIEIPGAPDLKGWCKTKVTEEEWAEIKESYEQAWHRLSPKTIVKCLNEKIEDRSKALEKSPAQLVISAPRVEPKMVSISTDGKSIRLKRQVVSDEWRWSQEEIARLGQILLRPGSQVMLCSAGSYDPAIALARKLGSCGTLHVWEPRQVLQDILRTAFLLSGLSNVSLHAGLPFAGEGEVGLPAFDQWTESNPQNWGNVHGKVTVPIISPESIAPDFLSLVVIQPPVPFIQTMQAMYPLVEKHRPALLLSLIGREEMGNLGTEMKKLGMKYKFLAEKSIHGADDRFFVIGVPEERSVNATGFMTVEFD